MAIQDQINRITNEVGTQSGIIANIKDTLSDLDDGLTTMSEEVSELVDMPEEVNLTTMTEGVAAANGEIVVQSELIEQIKDALQGKAASGGGSEEEWAEDDSEIVYEISCYQNSNVSACFSKNGTLTYKRNSLEYKNNNPKWQWSNITQMINSRGEYAKHFINARQAEVINIPEATEGYLITSLEQSAFCECSNLRIIKLPNTIKTLGNNVFSGCERLKVMVLPESVESMGSNIFRYCRAIEEFTIPPLVTDLGAYSFTECRMLKIVNGIERLVSIGTSCFDGCANLSGTITFNEALVSLGNSVFRDCCLIEHLIFNGIVTMTSSTFQNCVSIKYIEIPIGWDKTIYFTASSQLEQECLHKMIENLADMTGLTAPDFKVGATNIAKIDEYHIAMLENKNWNYS